VSQASAVAAPGVPGPGARGFKPEMDRLRDRMHGGLTWARDYWAEAAALPGPDLCGQPPDPAAIASSVVEAVTRAMALLRPAGAGRSGHG
jgi:hypothetical protein